MRLFSLSSVKLSCVVVIASLLSACGFHLRGNFDVPEELQKLSLTSYDQYSDLTRKVEAQLRLNKIDIVTPASNIPNLHLVSEGVGERTLSLYQNTRAAEKELTYRVSYRITVPELGMKTFNTSVTRSYLDNPLTALAKSVERDMIEEEMRQLASTQIIRQTARLKAQYEANELKFDEMPEETIKTEESETSINTVEVDADEVATQ